MRAKLLALLAASIVSTLAATASAGTAPNGTACSAATDCQSGFCVDNVCCDAACNGQCQACDVSGKLGTCAPVAGAPHGARTACAGTDTCKGACNGVLTSACVYPGATTSCGCAAGMASVCDGVGACGPQTSCSPYVCGGTSCKTICTGDVDCAAGFACNGGACVPKGATCGADGATSIATDGSTHSCAPYRCSPSTGTCITMCAVDTDCVTGLKCMTDRYVCADPATYGQASPNSGLGGCGVGGAPSGGGLFAAGALGVLLTAGAIAHGARRARRG